MMETGETFEELRTQIKDNDKFNAIEFLKKKRDTLVKYRQQFEKIWYRNILFYIGKQWIKYDNLRTMWTKIEAPDWLPTPVTNKIAPTIDTIASVFARVKPNMIFSPLTNKQEDRATAEIANVVNDICHEESGWDKLKDKFIIWLLLTGDVTIYPYYDNDKKHGVIYLPIFMCSSCGFEGEPHEFENNLCPKCGSPEIQDSGKKIEAPKGKISVDIIPNFELYVDLSIDNIEDQPFIIRAKTISLDEAKRKWPDKAENLRRDNSSDGNIGKMFYRALAYTTNSIDQNLVSGAVENNDFITIWELFIRPNDQLNLPNGYHGFITDNIVLEEGELEYKDENGVPYIPLIKMTSQYTPKRFFSKSFCDDLISKQIQRNKLESFLQLSIYRTANPVWLIPRSSGVKDISGKPGELIFFNDSMTGTTKPEKIGGAELTQSVFRWLEKMDSDFEELASTYDVLKGAAPQGIPTLGGMQLLDERATSRFTRLLENYENACKQLSRYFILIFRQFATEERTKLIKDKFGEWKEQTFSRDSLTGGFNISVEPGSSKPRSAAAKQFIIGQFVSQNLIDLQDLDARLEIFTAFNADNLVESLKLDFEDARKEELFFMRNGLLRFRPEIDNNAVHLQSHLKFAKSEEFFNLDIPLQDKFMKHIMSHKQMYMNQSMNLGNLQSPPPASAKPVEGGMMSLPEMKQNGG